MKIRNQIIFVLSCLVLLGNSCEEPKGELIGGNYWKAGNQVEFRTTWTDPQFKIEKTSQRTLENSDPASFIILPHPYSSSSFGKDKSQVYYQWFVIQGANPEEFEFLGEFYSRDKTTIFNKHKPVEKADISSFKVFDYNGGDFREFRNEFINTVVDAKDDNTLFNNGKPANRFTNQPDVKSFDYLSPYFFRDSTSLYRSFNGEKPADDDLLIIENVNPDSVTIIDTAGFYATDKNIVMVNVEGKNFYSFSPANPETFKALNRYYSKDSQFAYYKGEMIEGADLDSFRADGEYKATDNLKQYDARGNKDNDQ